MLCRWWKLAFGSAFPLFYPSVTGFAEELTDKIKKDLEVLPPAEYRKVGLYGENMGRGKPMF